MSKAPAKAALAVGDKAPDFSLPADGGESLSLKDFKGRKLVLYFYPKDDTSGCTAEACAFRDAHPAFRKLKVNILGASKDTIAKHDRFRAKYDLPFRLLSDEEGALCAAYGVWVKKSLYGRSYMGIERSTFLIDEKGVLRAIWRKVKVSGHVDEVQKALKDL